MHKFQRIINSDFHGIFVFCLFVLFCFLFRFFGCSFAIQSSEFFLAHVTVTSTEIGHFQIPFNNVQSAPVIAGTLGTASQCPQ